MVVRKESWWMVWERQGTVRKEARSVWDVWCGTVWSERCRTVWKEV